MLRSANREQFIEGLVDFIASVAYSELITVENNSPKIRPMVYVHEGLTIYMVSESDAAKVEQIKKNPQVSVMMIKSLTGEGDTKELIIDGVASICLEEEEREKVFALFKKQRRKYQDWLSADRTQCAVIKVTAKSLKYFDYASSESMPQMITL